MKKIRVALFCFFTVGWISLQAQAPTTQASNIVTAGGSSSQVQLSWTNGNGTKRMLVGTVGSSLDFTPTDNTIYTANSNFGSGQLINPGMYVLYNGTGASLTVNNISSMNQYTFRLFEYNGSAGAEKYLSTTFGAGGAFGSGCGGGGGSGYSCSFTGNPYTAAYYDGSQAANIVFRNVTATSVDVYYHAGNSASFLVAYAGGPDFTVPSGSTKYCAQPVYGLGEAFGTGYVVAAFSNGCSGWSCAVLPAISMVNISGLSPNTPYFFRAFEQSAGCSTNWLPDPGAGNNFQQFVKTKPDVAAGTIIFSGITTSQATLNWVNGNGTRRIVVANEFVTPTGPTDGIAYGANTVFGSGSKIGTSYVVYDGTGNTTPVTGLTAGTLYNFAIYEYNNPGSYATSYGSAATASITTVPPSTTAIQPSAATTTNNSFNASWTLAPGATNYYLDVSIANDFSTYVLPYQNLSIGNVLTYSVNSNLNANTTYYYRVRAANSSGTSANSIEITVVTAPAPPAVSAVTFVTNNSFSSNWSLSTAATNYELYVASDIGFSTIVYQNLSVGNVTTAVVNTGLSANTPFYYRLKAKNANGTSNVSSTISFTTAPAPPTVSSATSVTNNSFNANWSSSAGATDYELYVASDAGFTAIVYQNLSVGNVTTAVVNTGLSANTPYYYRLKAKNTNGTSNVSSTITLTTAPAPPDVSSPTSVTNNSFSANWSASTAATNYELYVASDAGFGTIVYQNLSLGNVTTAVVNTGLSANTPYYYRLKAKNTNGTSTVSSTISFTTAPAPPAVSAATSVTNNSFSANWSASTAATDYELYVASDAGFTAIVYQNLSVGNVTTAVVNTGLSANTTYYYRLKAKNTNGASNVSSTITMTTAPAPPAVSAATAVTNNSFSSNWSASTAATNYELYVASDIGFSTIVYQNLSVGNVTTAVVNTGLSANTTYYYRLKAKNTNGTSNVSLTIAMTTAPPPPAVLAATAATNNSFSANWSASTAATDYELYVASDIGFSSIVYQNLSVGNVTTAVVNTGLSANTTYYYRLKAKNTNGTSNVSSTITMNTAPAPPAVSAATAVTNNSFNANWSLSTAATDYELYVASDIGFSTIVYQNLSVGNVTTAVVNTGLSGNTTYYYRLKAKNANGASNVSSTITMTTAPASPAVSAATVVMSNSFNANWSASTAGTDYELYVASDIGFSTIVYQNLSIGNVTTAVVNTGLSANTTYYYRLKAKNANGISNVSSTITVTTAPVPPIASDASVITQNGFTANWSVVSGANKYLLEVSLTSNFSSFIPGYNPKTILTNSEAVTGLLSGTLYYYRVRSGNDFGESDFSATISQITKPAKPVGNPVDTKNDNSFLATWNSITGADHYLLDVTAYSSNFATFIPGYEAKIISGGLTENFVTGLPPDAAYSFRVRAVNDGGESANSDKVTTILGGTRIFSVTLSSFNNGTYSGGTINITGQIIDGFGVVTGTLVYKGVAGISLSEKPVSVNGTTFSVTVDDTMLDELGMEFSVKVRDETAAEDETSTERIYRSITASSPNTTIPFAPGFNGKSATYQMFSIPYVLEDKTIDGIFNEQGTYDKTKWRLFRFDGNTEKYLEYEAGLPNSIELGEGYWFNAVSDLAKVIQIGSGMVEQANQTDPFRLDFNPGWNQIGNPYPFNIDWNAIKAVNPDAGLNSLKLFEGGTYVKKDVLAAWKGAFVFSDNGGSVSFPVSAKTSSPGRISTTTLSSNPDEAAWELPITVSLNSLEQTSAIGMHPDAKTSKDRFDEITMPRFLDYLELDTHHPEFFAHYFASDVIPTTQTATWLFSATSNQTGGEATLRWNQQALSNSQSKIALLDLQAQMLVDMKITDSYAFSWSEGRQFKILYSRDGELLPGVTLLGNAYPNPFTLGVSIPFFLEQDQAHVEVFLYDLQGRKIKVLGRENVKAGIRRFDWDGNNDQGSPLEGGLYLYQLRGDKGILSQPKRLIKQ